MKTESTLIRHTLVVCGVVVAVASVIGLLYAARNLLPLIFGAILIAVVLNQVASYAGKILPDSLSDSLSRRVRITLIVTFLFLTACVSIYAFAHSASEQVVRLADRVEDSIGSVVAAAKDQPLIQRYMGEDAKLSSLLPSSAKSLGLARNFFATAFGGMTDVLILAFLAIYFCFSPDKYRSGAIRLAPTAWRERLSGLMSDSSQTLWRWMLGRLLAMAIVGILFGIGLAVIGIPMPIELGIFAGLVTFIPNIGGVAAVVPALLLASQQGSKSFLSVLVLYVAIQFVESYLITPIVQEHQVSLPPAMVVLTQILGGLIFGFWGIVFATPLVAVAMLWIKRLYVEDWLESRL